MEQAYALYNMTSMRKECVVRSRQLADFAMDFGTHLGLRIIVKPATQEEYMRYVKSRQEEEAIELR